MTSPRGRPRGLRTFSNHLRALLDSRRPSQTEAGPSQTYLGPSLNGASYLRPARGPLRPVQGLSDRCGAPLRPVWALSTAQDPLRPSPGPLTPSQPLSYRCGTSQTGSGLPRPARDFSDRRGPSQTDAGSLRPAKNLSDRLGSPLRPVQILSYQRVSSQTGAEPSQAGASPLRPA